MALPVTGCDVVLGVQWLVTLGPILWNFSAFSMQFQMGSKWVTLQGAHFNKIEMLNSKQGAKLLSMLLTSTSLQPCAYFLVGDSHLQVKSNAAPESFTLETLFPEDASWEILHDLQQKYPLFNPCC